MPSARFWAFIGSTVALLFLGVAAVSGQNVVIVVIDGARYSETVGGGEACMPFLWNVLRPQGTVWTNFRNEGRTNTVNGHTSIETGTWQKIANDGSERPTRPTIFEYFRKHTAVPESLACLVVGKRKLGVLSFSTEPLYGEECGARVFVESGDTAVFAKVLDVLAAQRPRLLMVNFADVDRMAHSGEWKDYLGAIHRVDSLVVCLWKILQSEPSYRENTVLLVTNDHGRHDDSNGDFRNHGDGCEGCRHIMLLAAGGSFSRGHVCDVSRTQRDLAGSIGEILGFPTPFVEGGSILGDTVSVRRPKETGRSPVPQFLEPLPSTRFVDGIAFPWAVWGYPPDAVTVVRHCPQGALLRASCGIAASGARASPISRMRPKAPVLLK